MGKKDEGGVGLGGYIIIIGLLLLLVDYVGLFNVPVVHDIDNKYIHPVADPKVMPYLQKLGIVPSFPTTLQAINNAETSTKHSIKSGSFSSAINGKVMVLNGEFIVSPKLLEGTRIGIAEVVTIKLAPPTEMMKQSLGEELYNKYVSVYNETGGSVVLIYYNDDVKYSVGTAGASISFNNNTMGAEISVVQISGETLKLAPTEGYKYYDVIASINGRVPFTKTATAVVFERVGNKWLKIGAVPGLLGNVVFG